MFGRKMIRGALAVSVTAFFAAVALLVLSQGVYAADFNSDIQRLIPSESMAIETGGGESPWMALKSTAFSNDAGRIESLLPSESIVPEEVVGGGETARVELRAIKLGRDTGNIERLAPSALDLSSASTLSPGPWDFQNR
ncbi:MAG: hypothetical protein ABSA46_12375 [Thermodesulfovibrionales bacterium]|jgi:hypothetical protein